MTYCPVMLGWTLYGDIGDDLLDGGSENDEIYGGDATIRYSAGAATIWLPQHATFRICTLV